MFIKICDKITNQEKHFNILNANEITLREFNKEKDGRGDLKEEGLKGLWTAEFKYDFKIGGIVKIVLEKESAEKLREVLEQYTVCI